MVKNEFEFVAIASAQREQFEREGFLVVPNALDSVAVGRLIEAGDRLMASGRQRDRETMLDGWDSYRNVIPTDHVFKDLLTHPKIFPLVVQILGPNIHLLSSQLIYLESRPPGIKRKIRTPAAPGWHRDIYGVAADLGHANIPRLAIKCGFYLTDVSVPLSGMTLFSPGSHLLKTDISIPSGAIDPKNAVDLKLRPGDCVLFENRTFHTGGINQSGKTRKCIMIQYGFRWLKPVDYTQLPESVTENCSPIQKQLLGTPDRDAAGRITMGVGSRALRQWCETHKVVYTPTQ